MKYVKYLRERFSKSLVFSLRDVNILFKSKNISKQYSNLLIHNMIKKKEIFRITKGKYTFNNEIMVTGFAFSPFYYGLQEALSLRNLWEQETNPIIITTTKAKPGVRNFIDSNIFVRRISKNYFFGFDFIKYYDFEIPISNIEKTLIDFVYYKEHLNKEVLNEIKQKLNKKRLNNYLEKYNKSIRTKVEDKLENTD